MSGMVSGKIAFVTGAASGIGKAISQILAKEGAKVIAADRNVEGAQEIMQILGGTGHLALPLDVTSSESVKKAFESSLEHYATAPTIIVNSAGITRDNMLLNMSEIDFNDVLDVNLKGTFLVTQIGTRTMIDAGVSNGASIVNLASIIGKFGGIGQCNYSASKAGVEAFTKSASMELVKLGIRINAVLPGFVDTPMTTVIPENIKKMILERISMKRTATPTEIAEVVAFLSSDKSSYMTGTSIEVTGGFR